MKSKCLSVPIQNEGNDAKWETQLGKEITRKRKKRYNWRNGICNPSCQLPKADLNEQKTTVHIQPPPWNESEARKTDE